MIYNSSELLPSYNFFKIIETGDYSYMFDDMVIDFKTKPDEIYNNISDEINDILGTKNDFKESNKLNKLKYKHIILTNIIEILSVKFDLSYIEWCNKNGYKFDYSTNEKYKESLKNLLRQSQSLYQKIQLTIEELSKEQNKSKLDMFHLNTQIEKYFKFTLDLKKICIKQYANYILDFKRNNK